LGQIYTKDYQFWRDNGEVLHEGAGLGLAPHAKFCKNHLRGAGLGVTASRQIL